MVLYLKSINNDWLVGYDSYQFSCLVEQLYLELVQLGQETSPKIILAQSEPIRFMAGFIAACAAGCPVFLCNPNWVKSEWEQVFDLVQPNIIWSDSPEIKQQGYSIQNPKEGYPIQNLKLALEGSEGSKIQNRIMIPTGGSSGKIRFAIHTWETLSASVQGMRKYFQLQQINSFCVLPLYHVSGLMQFIRSFTTNGKLVLLPFKALESGEIPELDPRQFFISLVPTQLQRLLENPTFVSWLSEFKTVLLGGAPAWAELLEQARSYGIRLALTYGMTETASQIVTLKPEDFLNGYNNCGKVLPHAKVNIISSTNQILDINQTGIVSIQSKSLALGYYPNLFTQPEELKLDDLGFFDDEGYLNIIGRNSNKIITGGENVYPNEVEAAIRATNLVKDVCVIGIRDRTWGQVVTAIYVPSNMSVTPAKIKAAIADKLSKFKQPKRWIPLDNLPRNYQGKINRLRLQEIAILCINDSFQTLESLKGLNPTP